MRNENTIKAKKAMLLVSLDAKKNLPGSMTNQDREFLTGLAWDDTQPLQFNLDKIKEAKDRLDKFFKYNEGLSKHVQSGGTVLDFKPKDIKVMDPKTGAVKFVSQEDARHALADGWSVEQ
jgi:hypothetical protein